MAEKANPCTKGSVIVIIIKRLMTKCRWIRTNFHVGTKHKGAPLTRMGLPLNTTAWLEIQRAQMFERRLHFLMATKLCKKVTRLGSRLTKIRCITGQSINYNE